MTFDHETHLQRVIESVQRQIFNDRLTTKIQPLGIRGDSVRCFLIDENQEVVAQGLGSGGGRQAVAQAMLKALGAKLFREKRCDAPVVLADPLILAEERILEPEVSVRRLLDARRRNTSAGISAMSILMREYHDLLHGEAVRIPLFLSIPEQCESAHSLVQGHDVMLDVVEMYSTHSGSGVGSTQNEALVAAIDECIERDALALLRVRSLSPSHLGAAPLSIISKESLPSSLQAMLASVEADVEGRIELLDLTTDLGMPVIAAVATPLTTRIQFLGISTGLSPEDAVRGALADLVLAVDTDRPTHDGSIGTLLKAGNIERIEFMTIPGEPAQNAEWELLDRIDLLQDAGFSVLASTTASLENELYAMHVVIPGLERCAGLSDGRSVATGDRGRAALDAAIGSGPSAAWAS